MFLFLLICFGKPAKGVGPNGMKTGERTARLCGGVGLPKIKPWEECGGGEDCLYTCRGVGLPAIVNPGESRITNDQPSLGSQGSFFNF